MKVIVTDVNTGRKYQIRPDKNGLCYQIWQTSNKAKGEKVKNGKTIKNEWQFMGKYPVSILHGLEIINDLMLADSANKDIIEIDSNDLKNLAKYIHNHIKQMANNIEVEK